MNGPEYRSHRVTCGLDVRHEGSQAIEDNKEGWN